MHRELFEMLPELILGPEKWKFTHENFLKSRQKWKLGPEKCKSAHEKFLKCLQKWKLGWY
jgi:hypothetical protein